ncbi:hypothetical protein FA13DRAFT_1718701 [Coprinellus micaceus]|uniref:Uncharacterized protein n=1 Tax=Coprinellus micaceus TaxID=71717 RepID=A0A4Y7SD22_COPMI|nr:hypothetical protein FA13DRAFT_1718701 [Coprinellus micaceus]
MVRDLGKLWWCWFHDGVDMVPWRAAVTGNYWRLGETGESDSVFAPISPLLESGGTPHKTPNFGAFPQARLPEFRSRSWIGDVRHQLLIDELIYMLNGGIRERGISHSSGIYSSFQNDAVICLVTGYPIENHELYPYHHIRDPNYQIYADDREPKGTNQMAWHAEVAIQHITNRTSPGMGPILNRETKH